MTPTTLLHQKFGELLKRFGTEGEFSAQGYTHFIKGDISGIQDFIFSVKSEGASKSLKGRSFFVQAIAKIIIRRIEEEVGQDNIKIFYDGGGNFYLFAKIPARTSLESMQADINETFRSLELYVSLMEIDMRALTFSEIWQRIQTEAQQQKLRRFSDNIFLFSPYEMDPMNTITTNSQGDTQPYQSLAGKFNGNYDLASEKGNLKGAIQEDSITLLETKMNFRGQTENMKDWVSGLPIWDEGLLQTFNTVVAEAKRDASSNPDKKTVPRSGMIVEFSDLSAFARVRTGTDKLAVLKMDVDNLGKLFGGLADWASAQKASIAMSWFFGAFMRDLLQETYLYKSADGTEHTVKFADNLYVVFSGGDDTFIVGAWDAAFEFAALLHDNFTAFSDALQQQPINGLPNAVTLSAGLVVVDPKFPVVRFASLAEEALSEAKSWKSINGQKNLKNRISAFGQVLTWDEFKYARDLAIRTANLIKFEGESRALIERIKRVARDYERLQERAKDGKIYGPKVHRLFYTMRNLKNLPAVEQDIKAFSASLLDAFIKKQKVSYPKFPVAARWAEFLTRKSKTY